MLQRYEKTWCTIMYMYNAVLCNTQFSVYTTKVKSNAIEVNIEDVDYLHMSCSGQLRQTSGLMDDLKYTIGTTLTLTFLVKLDFSCAHSHLQSPPQHQMLIESSLPNCIEYCPRHCVAHNGLEDTHAKYSLSQDSRKSLIA